MKKVKKVLFILAVLFLAELVGYVLGHAVFEFYHGRNIFLSYESFIQSYDTDNIISFLCGYISSALVTILINYKKSGNE